MSNKIFIVFSYVFTLLGAGLAPVLVNLNIIRIKVPATLRSISAHLLAIFISILMLIKFNYGLMQWMIIFASAILVIICAKLPLSLGSILTGFLSIVASTTLLWWLNPQSTESGINYLQTGLVLSGILIITNLQLTQYKKLNSRLILISSIWAYIIFSAFFCLTTLTTRAPIAVHMIWHHWSAYLGPAKLFASGAKIFYDFPAQYGLGPTVLLSMACKSDCWEWAFTIFGVMSFAYALTIGLIIYILSRREVLLGSILLAAGFFACIFWTSFPPLLSSPVTTPSTSGMRFLIPTILAGWLVFIIDSHREEKNLFITLAHLIWFAGILWSPEAGFCSTIVWAPAYVLIKSRILLKRYSAIKSFVIASANLIAIFICIVAFSTVTFKIALGYWPEPAVYLAYVLHPPGPLPVNPRGSIWFFGIAILISAATIIESFKNGKFEREGVKAWILQLLAISTFSYFLGRSHDNNILNLMPCIILILSCSISTSKNSLIRFSSAISVSAIICFAYLFNWSGVWGFAVDSRHYRVLSNLGYAEPKVFNLQTLGVIYKEEDASLPEKLNSLSSLIDEITAKGESFDLLDRFLILPPTKYNNSWSALHAPENYTHIPSNLRTQYVERTKNTLSKDGWLIIADNFDATQWLKSYDYAYKRTGTRSIMGYHAIHFTPR